MQLFKYCLAVTRRLPRKVLGYVRFEIFDLVHRVNGASKGLVRFVLSSVHSRIILLPSAGRGGAAGSRSACRRGSLQSLLKLSPCVPQLDSTIEDEPPGLG